MASGEARVSICIPAFRSGAFIAETLSSALAQTWPVDIAVSIDPAPEGTEDDTADIVRHMLSGTDATIVKQPRRLGWIGNCNAALALARSDFAMLLPHDDALDPRYVAACMDALLATPASALAFSDIDGLNKPGITAQERSETGPVHRRIAGMFHNHFPAIAFRGVFPRQTVRQHRVPDTVAGFGADSLWVLKMAAQGAIVRVPETLYHKRFHNQSAHQPWYRATKSELDEMWIVHCIEALRTIAASRPTVLAGPGVHRAWRARLERTEVAFHTEPGLPSILDPKRPLLPQAWSVYRKVARRTPPYSWFSK